MEYQAVYFFAHRRNLIFRVQAVQYPVANAIRIKQVE